MICQNTYGILHSECNCNEPVNIVIEEMPQVVESLSVDALYEELGRISWIGADEGWDKAIVAVRAYIRENR